MPAGGHISHHSRSMPVCEQECYLRHEGDNDAIIRCLKANEAAQAQGALVILFIFGFITWLFMKDKLK